MSRTDTQAMRYGIAANTFMGDPRINPAQMRAIASTCAADSEARLLGIDSNNRPVIRARLGIPRQPRTWAILRNGEVADPARLTETWQAGRR